MSPILVPEHRDKDDHLKDANRQKTAQGGFGFMWDSGGCVSSGILSERNQSM